MQEKIHKIMTFVGNMSIIIGVVTIVVGVAGGVLMIVGGGKLLNERKTLIF